MPKRIVRVLENGRHVSRGASMYHGRHTMVLDEGETDIVRIECNEWLDSGETVSASALSDQSGVTITKRNNSTSVDLTCSGVTSNGEAALSITTSAGRVKVVPLRWRVPERARVLDAYDFAD